MKSILKRNSLVALLAMACAVTAWTIPQASAAQGDGRAAARDKSGERTYYMISSHQAHPYFSDSHLGLRYAAEYFNVNIEALGPEGWDTKAQSEAIEQVIPKNPSGIITRMWDAAPRNAVRKAMEMGIPVILTETTIEDSGALAYIGLDNYQCGRDTAKELVRRAGDTGKVVCMGNWGASNTDSKVRGVEDYLREHTKWEVVAKVDDKAETNAAIEAAKSVFNNYPNIDAIAGLDSSSGSGIALAMEELRIPAGKVTVVVHDREVSTLEFIEKGYITSTLINKTAAQEYIAILIMEDWNNGGLKGIPVSSNNAAAGVNTVPEHMYNTAAIIDKANVQYFLVDNMPELDTKLYNY